MNSRVTALLLLALGCPRAAAQTSGAAFLEVTPSARAYALGMANGITALGAEAIGANPANLGLMDQRFEVFTSYASLLDGTRFTHLSAAFAPRQSLPLLDGLGLSVTRLDSSGFQGADALGNKTGSSFSSSDLAVSLSGSAKLSSSLRLGATGKAVQSSIAGYRSQMAPAADVGLTYTLSSLSQPISVGASLTNLGPGTRFLQQTDRPPTTANLGLALPLGPAMAVLEVNRLLSEQRTQASVGVELAMGPVFFRAGYLAQNQAGNLALADHKGGAILGNFSGGVGLKIGSARLDYAMSQQAADYGTTSRVALSLRWGGQSERLGRQDAGWRSDSSWRGNPDRSDWLLRPLGSY